MNVHDLVRITDEACARIAQAAPAWTRERLAIAPWVVVRRDRRDDGIAAGVRGLQRAQRYGVTVDPHEAIERRTPEMLASVTPKRAHPVFDALRSALIASRACGLRCGPAGAAGFELATGLETLHDGSDLDVIVYAEPFDSRLAAFAAQLRGLAVRVDAEVLFGDGCGAALQELCNTSSVLVKTPLGPRLMERTAP